MAKKTRKRRSSKTPAKTGLEGKIDHCAIDPHFDGGTWDLMNNPGGAGEFSGELVLWRKVVKQAIFDFCSAGKTAPAIFNQAAAERWLLEGGKSFFLVCDLADIPAEILRRDMRLAVANPRTVMAELRARTNRP